MFNKNEVEKIAALYLIERDYPIVTTGKITFPEDEDDERTRKYLLENNLSVVSFKSKFLDNPDYELDPGAYVVFVNIITGEVYMPPHMGVKQYAHFQARNCLSGRPTLYLPEKPTVLQVKHELSHWLDCKSLGVDKYSKLTTLEKEQMVLDRLKKNRVWEELNIEERIFSTDYVQDIADKMRNDYIGAPKYVD